MCETSPLVSVRKVRPQRIQLRRTKGWRMPENTVRVDRCTRWGNPFGLPYLMNRFDEGPAAAQQRAVRMFRQWLLGKIPGPLEWRGREGVLGRQEPPEIEQIRNALAGKNLACWCPPDLPCHADVLLEIANGGAA